jgi:hypothetical protein
VTQFYELVHASLCVICGKRLLAFGLSVVNWFLRWRHYPRAGGGRFFDEPTLQASGSAMNDAGAERLVVAERLVTASKNAATPLDQHCCKVDMPGISRACG